MTARATERGRQLRGLLAPRSVAVVGASPKGGFGKYALLNLGLLGFDGPVYAVNPGYDEIEGIPCRPSLAAIEEKIDAVAVAVPAAAVESVLAQAADRGIRNAAVYAGGLGEGATGKEREASLATLIAQRQLNVIGPNCLGSINYADRSALWVNPIAEHRAGTPEGAALIAQSGNMALNLISAAPALPLTHVISCGNQLDLTVADLLDYLVGEERVKVVGVLIEGVPDVEHLKASLERAANANKPVVALKAGTTEAGLRSTVAHTGALSAAGDSYRAFFRQYGVVAVDSPDEMIAACTVLSAPRPIRGGAVAVMTNSGGECALIADTATSLGLTFPEVPPAQAAELAAVLPDFAAVQNPLDVTAALWGNEDVYGRVVSTLGSIPGVDAVVSVTNFPVSPPPDEAGWPLNIAGMARAAARLDVPVFGLSILSTIEPSVTTRIRASGIVPLPGLQPAMKALALSARWARWQAVRRPRPAPALSPAAPRRREQARRLLGGNARVLGESDSKALLSLYGIASPRGTTVRSADDAVREAEALGLPVVMKLEAEGLHHKSDVGAVAVGVDSPERVRAEFGRLIALAAGTEATAEPGVRVEQYAPGTPELLLGVKRERDLGPVVVVGMGGVLVEVLKDTSRRLAPLVRSDVDEMLAELQSAPLLHGYRGSEPVDVAALADVVVALAGMAVELPEVAEVDVNPVVFSPQRGGWIALDALVARS